MLLILDNYDSFTWNLVQYFGELGADPLVIRNDRTTVADVLASGPDGIVISPGPCTPAEAGISVELIRAAGAGGIPLLGVCLGHQAIGEAFGASVVRADRMMHGKTSEVRHDGSGVFAGLPDPVTVMRYHSLVIDPATVTPDLRVTAWTADRPDGSEIMAVTHAVLPVWGVQFHPESIATPTGLRMLENFLTESSRRR